MSANYMQLEEVKSGLSGGVPGKVKHLWLLLLLLLKTGRFAVERKY